MSVRCLKRVLDGNRGEKLQKAHVKLASWGERNLLNNSLDLIIFRLLT